MWRRQQREGADDPGRRRSRPLDRRGAPQPRRDAARGPWRKELAFHRRPAAPFRWVGLLNPVRLPAERSGSAHGAAFATLSAARHGNRVDVAGEGDVRLPKSDERQRRNLSHCRTSPAMERKAASMLIQRRAIKNSDSQTPPPRPATPAPKTPLYRRLPDRIRLNGATKQMRKAINRRSPHQSSMRSTMT